MTRITPSGRFPSTFLKLTGSLSSTLSGSSSKTLARSSFVAFPLKIKGISSIGDRFFTCYSHPCVHDAPVEAVPQAVSVVLPQLLPGIECAAVVAEPRHPGHELAVVELEQLPGGRLAQSRLQASQQQAGQVCGGAGEHALLEVDYPQILGLGGVVRGQLEENVVAPEVSVGKQNEWLA